MMYLVLTIITIKLIHQILFFLYIFQLKEYRLDRLKEHIRRVYKTRFNIWFHLTIGAPIDSILYKLPKPSPKAILLTGFSILITVFFFFIEPSLVFMALFFSPSIVLFSWFTILPFEITYKKYIFNKAKKKIELFKKNHKLTVIGITGSYGKTTVKTFVTAVLQSKFSVVTTPKSINTPVGIAGIILNNLKPSHSFFIVEMGAYKRGEITELCNMSQPDIGILTGISDQHLALFGSQKNIIYAKSELIEALPANGTAVINKNSDYEPNIKKSKVKNIIYYSYKDLPKSFEKLGFPKTAFENLTPAYIIGEQYGLTVGEMINTLQIAQLPPTALNISKPTKKITIIDDTSNANTKGFLEAINILKHEDKEIKIIITPCVIELGMKGSEFHQNLADKMSKIADYVIFTTRDYEKEIKKGWGNAKNRKLLFIENTEEIINYIQPLLKNDCAILLEGKLNKKITEFLISNK